MENFRDNLLLSLQENYNSLVNSLPNIIIGLIVLFLFWLISKYVVKIIEHGLKERLEDQLVLRFIIKTARLLLLGIAVLSFLKIVGLGNVAAGLWGTAGIGAFILGFAFKDIGEHFLAGFILAFNRPFRVGDTVEMIGHLGTVEGLNLRNTHIKTFDGKDVYIPNGTIIKSPLINYTIDGYIRKTFVLSIGYQIDQKEAVLELNTILSRHPAVLKAPKGPAVLIKSLNPKAIELNCMYWLNTLDKSISSGQVELDLVNSCVAMLQAKGMLFEGNSVTINSLTE